MADELEPESTRVQLRYPTRPNAYGILEGIGGGGASATVHKAMCFHNTSKSTLVAIKMIDLEQSPDDLDSLRRESMTMSLLSHPNVLASHCSFVVDHRLWLVMPYMAAGSLQSIVSSYFPDGLPEECIAIILKETLKGLLYLHDQGHLHTDIKADNILIDTDDNGSIKLAGIGKSVSIYDSSSIMGSPSLSLPSRMRLTDVSGTSYWMAPEVIHDPDTGYSFQADIWSFGITALELAYGRPPFSHLPPSVSLIMKIEKRFGFSDYHDEKHKKDLKKKKFSKDFKDMVASCLDQDRSKRPYPHQLLEYSFFKNCKGLDFLFKEVFDGLPNVEETFKGTKSLQERTSGHITGGADTRRIICWKFNEGEFELDPEFLIESDDDAAVKMVRFGGETIIPDTNIGFGESSGGSGDLEGLVGDHTGANTSGIEGIAEGFNQETVLEGFVGDHTGANTIGIEGIAEGFYQGIVLEGLVGDHTGANMSGIEGTVGGLNRGTMLEGLVALKRSLDEQRRKVVALIVLSGGEADGEEQMVQRIENLMEELDLEKEKNFKLEMDLKFINSVISGAYNDAAAAGDSVFFNDID